MRSGKMTAPNPLDETEVGEFVDKVDEISRLIDGLSKGTISPEYIDRKMEQKAAFVKDLEDAKKSGGPASKADVSRAPEDAAAQAAADKAAAEKEKERRSRLQAKAAELKANYERKLKARARFDEYSAAGGAPHHLFGTDYTKWDMWCPEDDEDELINSLTPTHNPAFRAMEKDIDERHNRYALLARNCCYVLQ